MSSDYKLIYRKDAVKFIAKLEKAAQEVIAQGLKGLLVIPPHGDIKPMKGRQGLYRLRNALTAYSLKYCIRRTLFTYRPLIFVVVFIKCFY